MTTIVGKNSFLQGRLVKIRPQGICKIELTVGSLPWKEIAQTQFSTSTDNQVWVSSVIRQMLGEEIVANQFLCDVTWVDFGI